MHGEDRRRKIENPKGDIHQVYDGGIATCIPKIVHNEKVLNNAKALESAGGTVWLPTNLCHGVGLIPPECSCFRTSNGLF
jgi:hypothetical protein